MEVGDKVIEEWKDIKEYEGLYQISNYGLVKSFISNKILKYDIKYDGHKRVTLCRKGKTKKFNVHRLVLETFVGSCPEGMECRHLDNDASNNKVSNLEWSTHYENMQDKYKFKTIIREKCIRKNCKLNVIQIRIIRYLLKTKVLLQKEIAKIFDVADSQISEIKNNNQWSHIR